MDMVEIEYATFDNGDSAGVTDEPVGAFWIRKSNSG